MEVMRQGVKYVDIRTKNIVDIPPRIGIDLLGAYTQVGADKFIEYVNSWLGDTDVELVKKKGGKK